ncbi:hypothetical protein DET0799 [Dehalococcoides mccartyi 195]|uniref:Uncharacterized protein n=1 Tax=Dehalococcoides mccartyi (strain ATCC BAA-2266 / KCTC 15142 / 195) TaxID=243164 RepID=Q3Z8B8_DEHM1|nr:hypothetical protein DET0799 [Dehalococcoides mccartyi 195]
MLLVLPVGEESILPSKATETENIMLTAAITSTGEESIIPLRNLPFVELLISIPQDIILIP